MIRKSILQNSFVGEVSSCNIYCLLRKYKRKTDVGNANQLELQLEFSKQGMQIEECDYHCNNAALIRFFGPVPLASDLPFGPFDLCKDLLFCPRP